MYKRQIEYIKDFSFGEQELSYLERKGYGKSFVEYLKNLKFSGDIYAIPDGTPVFPNEPIITVKAPIIEAQLIETAILSMVNGAMEHATGARRIVEATPDAVSYTHIDVYKRQLLYLVTGIVDIMLIRVLFQDYI